MLHFRKNNTGKLQVLTTTTQAYDECTCTHGWWCTQTVTTARTAQDNE